MRNLNSKFKIILILIFLLHITHCTLYIIHSHAEPLSSAELIEKAKEFDGKNVSYKGEAVTAVLNRGEFSWVNLNDGANAIGVWCRTSDLESIKFIGDYKHKGDILEVGGTLNRACNVHGGEMDIHASTIKVIENGHFRAESLNKNKIVLSIALFSLALSTIIIFRKRI